MEKNKPVPPENRHQGRLDLRLALGVQRKERLQSLDYGQRHLGRLLPAFLAQDVQHERHGRGDAARVLECPEVHQLARFLLARGHRVPQPLEDLGGELNKQDYSVQLR